MRPLPMPKNSPPPFIDFHLFSHCRRTVLTEEFTGIPWDMYKGYLG